MAYRPHEAAMPEPLGYLLTWATYGTWLPGDERGWTKWHGGPQSPNLRRELDAAARMNETPVLLDAEQRRVVEATIEQHCQIRGWTLLSVDAPRWFPIPAQSASESEQLSGSPFKTITPH